MGRLLDTYRYIHSAAGPNAGVPTPLQEATYLNSVLGILDSKASALMRFDAILFAASSFILKDSTSIEGVPIAKIMLVIILLMSLAAAGLCLLVVKVSYPFLGKININSIPADCATELEALDSEQESRTGYYRWAWRLSSAAIIVGLMLGAIILMKPLVQGDWS